jgi:hypothetical protein
MAILESDLSKEALKLLEDEYDVYTEVPLYNRCIDAVLIKGEKLITIEFKIKDWKRAIRQIKTHMLAADYAYLCMPEKNIPSELKQVLHKLGIGLWLFDIKNNRMSEYLAPQPSSVQLSVLKEKLLKYLSIREVGDGYTPAFD